MRVWFALGMLVALALSGCTSDDADSNDLVLDEGTELPGLEGLVLEQLAANGTEIQFSISAAVEDANATWQITAQESGTEDAEAPASQGNESSEGKAQQGNETSAEATGGSDDPNATTDEEAIVLASGTGLPANATVVFEESGAYTVTVEVLADGFAATTATLDVVVEAAEAAGDAAEGASDVPRGAQDPIQITNTITGVPEAGMSNTETFELVSVPSKMTLAFTNGATAIDLDFYLYGPDGKEVGSAGSFEALGGPGSSEAPLEITGAALEQLGEWSIDVVGYTAVEGEYTIDIAFE